MGKQLCFLLLTLFAFQVNAQQERSPCISVFNALEDSTESTFKVSITPQRLGIAFTSDKSRAIPTGFLVAGAHIKKKRWQCDILLEALQDGSTFLRRAIEAGWDRRSQSGLLATRWRGRWQWAPLESLQIVIGRDTLSEGWGIRSLFRGRHAAPAPFAQINLDDGGRLRYHHRIELLQDRQHMGCWMGAIGDPRTWIPPSGFLRSEIQKMMVTHRLEVDFGKRLTGALWGAVIWNSENGQRVFEPHYLLPLTSLRPTEYAQGSSDNALVGLEGRIKLGRKWERRPRMLYGQFLLDELIVEELLGATGWWGNKFSLLGGIQWDTRWGGWRWEISAARPWTYSHYTSNATYTHGITPLAHPLGANFIETTWNGRWQKSVWKIEAHFTASVRGDDPIGDAPTGSMPQIGDIQKTEERYSWLNGALRKRSVAFLDIAKKIRLLDSFSAQVFFQTALGWESGSLDNLSPANELRIGLGLRSSGPFFGADW
ncbi:MAG: hypothetical protein CMN34_05200 [Saprospirales bacterium]|nr:hypothetical protein [Saprospirales bacterium]